MLLRRLFFSFIVRDLVKNWLRSFITVFGIALGVSVFLAISLANDTAIKKFRETVDVMSGKANLEVRSASGRYIALDLLNELSWLEKIGVRTAPLIEETVAFGAEGKEPVKLVGIDVLADPDFFAGGVGTNESFDMFAPNSALVGWKLAEKYGLEKGSKFTLHLNDRTSEFRVEGVLDKNGLGGVFSGNVVATDLENAQACLNIPGKISAIDLIVKENEIESVIAELKEVLPPSIEASRPQARGTTVEKMTRSFQYNLTALAFIALIVGMFLIYNTITISVIRRRTEIGTLRTLGLKRFDISLLFLTESFLFGIVGSLLGVVFGVAFADGALSAIAGTLEHFYFSHPLGSTSVDPMLLVRAFFMGVGITVFASLLPIWESTTVQPAETVRRSSYESKVLEAAGRLFLVGVLLFALAYAAALAPAVFDFPVFGYVSALLTILGMAFSTPLLVRVSFSALGASNWLKKIAGTEGLLAARILLGASGRTSLAVASLAIGISMMISLAIMISSFRSTVVAWVDQTMKADLWLQPEARARGSRQARMDESVLDSVRALPAVAAADALVEQRMTYKGEPAIVAGCEFPILEKFGCLKLTTGQSVRALQSKLTDDACLISESFAIRKHVVPGETITVATNNRQLSLKVAAVYYDYSNDLGVVVMNRKLFEREFDDHTLTSIAVYLKPEVSIETAREEIVKALAGRTLVNINTTRELRREAMRVFDRTFAVTYALHTIAVSVALLSVMNALFALSFESRRDFGILRYLGAQRKQIRKIVYGQSLLLGLLGNVTGIVIGGVLSLLLVNVINKQSFGWTVQLEIPFDFIGQSAVLVLLAALAAGYIPARQAARTLAPEVVRNE